MPDKSKCKNWSFAQIKTNPFRFACSSNNFLITNAILYIHKVFDSHWSGNFCARAFLLTAYWIVRISFLLFKLNINEFIPFQANSESLKPITKLCKKCLCIPASSTEYERICLIMNIKNHYFVITKYFEYCVNSNNSLHWSK